MHTLFGGRNFYRPEINNKFMRAKVSVKTSTTHSMLQPQCSQDSQYSYVVALNLLRKLCAQDKTTLLISADVTLLEMQIVYVALGLMLI
jgi:hypothetical protein